MYVEYMQIYLELKFFIWSILHTMHTTYKLIYIVLISPSFCLWLLLKRLTLSSGL